MNLPAPYLRAVLASLNSYDREGSEYSITGLLAPPRAAVIKDEKFGLLSEDAADVVYRLLGSAFHAMVEWACKTPDKAVLEGDWQYAGDPDDLRVKGPLEERFHTTIDGHTVSAKIDYYDTENRILYDIKTTSVWGYVFDKDEWTEQLNGTRPMLNAHGLPDPKVLRIIGIWRDWSKNRVGDKYPPHQISVIDKDVWPFDRCLAFLERRVSMHENAKGHLPQCTDEERWKGFDKKAKKTVYRRCAAYCAAYRWCSQANEAAQA